MNPNSNDVYVSMCAALCKYIGLAGCPQLMFVCVMQLSRRAPQWVRVCAYMNSCCHVCVPVGVCNKCLTARAQ